MIQVNTVTVFYFILVLVLMAMIVYYNIIAGINYTKALEVNVQEPLQCDYPNLQVLSDDNINKDNNYFINKDNICFSLDIKQSYYLTVCSQLCGGSTKTTGQCY